jgi:hypothetical protein
VVNYIPSSRPSFFKNTRISDYINSQVEQGTSTAIKSRDARFMLLPSTALTCSMIIISSYIRVRALRMGSTDYVPLWIVLPTTSPHPAYANNNPLMLHPSQNIPGVLGSVFSSPESGGSPDAGDAPLSQRIGLILSRSRFSPCP